MARPGRKRRAGPRTPKGRLKAPQTDRGTPEVQSRRDYLAGRVEKSTVTYPVGVMLANSLIGQREHDSATRLAWLYAVVFHRPSVSAMVYERRIIGQQPFVDEVRLERYKEEMEFIIHRLACVSLAHKNDMLNLCVFERWPNFLLPRFPTMADVRHAERIRAGFRCLTGISN